MSDAPSDPRLLPAGAVPHLMDATTDAATIGRTHARTLIAPRFGRVRTVATLVAADLIALLLAGGLVAAVAWATSRPIGVDVLIPLAGFAGLAVAALAGSGLYPGVGIGRVEELRRIVRTIGAVAVTFGAAFVLRADWIGFADVLLAALLAAPLIPVSRGVARHLNVRRPWWGVPVVVFGSGPSAERLIGRLIEHPGVGFRPVAIFTDDLSSLGRRLHGVPVVGRIEEARGHRRYGVRHALLTAASFPERRLGAVVRSAGDAFPKMVVVPDLDGLTDVGAASASLGGELGLQVRRAAALRLHRAAKRVLDLILLIPAGLVAAPIVGLCALWVRLASKGSPFYFQVREGLHGKPIKVWKLRTMHMDAEALLERYLNENPVARTEWQTKYKLTHDPRILPGAGDFLRKTSLDELPQLWNIARGEMSFIGPRPFPYYHLAAFPQEFQALRRTVIPGLSGLWQISARSDGDLGVQEKLDTRYIGDWSIWLDLYILACTPWAVLRGKGAY